MKERILESIEVRVDGNQKFVNVIWHDDRDWRPFSTEQAKALVASIEKAIEIAEENDGNFHHQNELN